MSNRVEWFLWFCFWAPIAALISVFIHGVIVGAGNRIDCKEQEYILDASDFDYINGNCYVLTDEGWEHVEITK